MIMFRKQFKEISSDAKEFSEYLTRLGKVRLAEDAKTMAALADKFIAWYDSLEEEEDAL